MENKELMDILSQRPDDAKIQFLYKDSVLGARIIDASCVNYDSEENSFQILPSKP